MKRQKYEAAQPSCVLLCGNTKFLDKKVLKRITELYTVVMVTEDESFDQTKNRISKKLHIYQEKTTSENFSKLLYSYTPDVVWYFSGYLDDGEGLENENKKLESLIRCCCVNEISKLIVVTSADSIDKVKQDAFDSAKKQYATAKAFACAQMEELVRFYTTLHPVKTVLLRVPYLVGEETDTGFLDKIFHKILEDQDVSLPARESCPIDFLTSKNLSELLVAVTEETMDEAGEYIVFSGFHHLMRDLGGALKKIRPTLSVTYDEEAGQERNWDPDAEAERVRKNYGFVATDDVVGSLDDHYLDYKAYLRPDESLKSRLQKRASKYSHKVFRIFEMGLLFALIQVLLRYTTDNVYFRYVDLRLFFVLICGGTYGMIYGILAGAAECVSLIISYMQAGVTGTMLFYNMDYWLPFSIYLMTGAITGYMMNTRNQKLKFAQEEVETLQDKYMFLNNVYQSVVDNKEEYKKQILGYQDSFGKIFEAVEQLNSSTPADIFRNGVDTLERILDNHTIAIYTLDDSQAFGRLVACSSDMSQRLGKSVKIDLIKEVYDTISSSETWKNSDFDIGYPMYAYGIVGDNKVRLMICIYEAGTDQMGLYYMNLFTILCHLIRVAFLRALEYQEAIESEKYYPDTQILQPSFFAIELESRRRMADAGVASYVLLEIETDDFNATSVKLQGMIRHSDEMGNDEEGRHYLLLTQMGGDIFKIIGKRLDANEISYRVLEGI